jgi:hypothetical protein
VHPLLCGRAAFPRATVLRVCGADGMDRHDCEFVHEWAAAWSAALGQSTAGNPHQQLMLGSHAGAPAMYSPGPPPHGTGPPQYGTGPPPYGGGSHGGLVYAPPQDFRQPTYAVAPDAYGSYTTAQQPVLDPAAYGYYGLPTYPPC